MAKRDDRLRQVMEAHQAAEEVRKTKGSRYYEEGFKAAVRAAVKQDGVSLVKVHRATGISMSTLHSWLKGHDNEHPKPLLRKIDIQRPIEDKDRATVYLSSGVRIELPVQAIVAQLHEWLRACA